MSAGLGLALISVAIMVMIVVINPFIKRYLNYYVTWIVIGGFALWWMLAFRCIPGWIDYIYAANNGLLDNPADNYCKSCLISKAFLADLCPLAGLLLPTFLLCDPSRRLAQYFSPLVLLGGLIVVLGQIPGDPDAAWTIQYILFGTISRGVDNPGNEVYFFMHALNSFLALSVLLNAPRRGLKSFFMTNMMAIVFYLYVGIVIAITDCQWNVSGLSPKDWENSIDAAGRPIIGEYWRVAEILGFGRPWCIVLGLSVGWCMVAIFILLKEKVFYKGVCRYGNQKLHWWCWYDIDGPFVTQKVNYNIFLPQGE